MNYKQWRKPLTYFFCRFLTKFHFCRFLTKLFDDFCQKSLFCRFLTKSFDVFWQKTHFLYNFSLITNKITHKNIYMDMSGHEEVSKWTWKKCSCPPSCPLFSDKNVVFSTVSELSGREDTKNAGERVGGTKIF